MNKKAQTQHPIHHLLEQRWSPRAFSNKTVEKQKLLSLFEAARWSPSASNLQPWYYILGQNKDTTYKKIFETLVEFNQMWAGMAPVLVLCVGKGNINHKADQNQTFKYDVGQSVAHLSIQAMAEGLYVHQMSGFDTDKACNLFEIPADYEALAVLAIGYIGQINLLLNRMQKAEAADRERKELKEFVFSEKFGQTSNIVE